MKDGELPAHDKSESICLTIVRQIAEEEGVDPLELDPLHYTLDTDALENLVEGVDPQDLRVDFRYHGYEVSVGGDELVKVNKM